MQLLKMQGGAAYVSEATSQAAGRCCGGPFAPAGDPAHVPLKGTLVSHQLCVGAHPGVRLVKAALDSYVVEYAGCHVDDRSGKLQDSRVKWLMMPLIAPGNQQLHNES
jgi:hypothetical protein